MTTLISKKSPPTSDDSEKPAGDALASLRIERPEGNIADRSHRRWYIFAAVLLLVATGFWVYQAGFGGGAAGSTSDLVPDILRNRREVRLVSVSVQTGRSADAVVVATGYLESRRQAKIGARAPGRIEVIKFEEGSRVTEDEILAILEHADMDASLAAAAASVSRAKAALSEQAIAIEQALREMNRAESLRKQNSISESEYDQARFAHQSAVARKNSLQADLELASARHSEAEQLRENMFIRAPFDGTVISKDAEVGESILPGGMGEASGRGSVATIADLDHLEIECDVKEDFITRVKEEQEAEISVDAVPNKKYRGRVRKIIPMGDRARATIKVQVEVLDADDFLFPEMSGTVYFLQNRDIPGTDTDAPRMFCASSAVTTTDDGEASVWVVESGRHAKRIPVTVGDSRDGQTEILDGLSGKERVIANPQEIVEGELVKIAE